MLFLFQFDVCVAQFLHFKVLFAKTSKFLLYQVSNIFFCAQVVFRQKRLNMMPARPCVVSLAEVNWY